MSIRNLVLSALLLSALVSNGWAKPVPMKDNVGASSGVLSGADGIDYTFQGQAGQKLAVAVFSDAPASTIINVFSPKSKNGEADVFSNYVSGELANQATLPANGTYTLRLGLRKPDRENGSKVNYTFTVALTGGASAAAPESSDSAEPLRLRGTGTYMVTGNPVVVVQSLDLSLNKDGSAKVGVNLGGDGFFVSGSWAQLGSHGVLLGLKDFAGTSAKGTGSITYGENHQPSKIFLNFEVPGQKTHHSLVFHVQ
jgi:hypothetical protein